MYHPQDLSSATADLAPTQMEKLKKPYSEMFQEPTGGASNTTQYVRLQVVGQDSDEIHFKVKQTTQMGKLKKSYSKIYQEQTGDVEYTEYIKLKLVGQDSNEIHFRVKHTTQMEKLKKSYSEKVRVPITSLRFLFDGRRINDDETPQALEVKQDDVIEVFREQAGGGDILDYGDYSAEALYWTEQVSLSLKIFLQVKDHSLAFVHFVDKCSENFSNASLRKLFPPSPVYISV